MQLSFIDNKGLQLRNGDCEFWFIEAYFTYRLVDLDLADVANTFAWLQKENSIIKHDATIVLFFDNADQIKALFILNFYHVLLGLLHRKKITVY